MTARNIISWLLLGTVLAALAWAWRDVRRAEAQRNAVDMERTPQYAAGRQTPCPPSDRPAAALPDGAATLEGESAAEEQVAAEEDESWRQEEEARRERERAEAAERVRRAAEASAARRAAEAAARADMEKEWKRRLAAKKKAEKAARAKAMKEEKVLERLEEQLLEISPKVNVSAEETKSLQEGIEE